MSTKQETVVKCDICGKRVSDEGETWFGGHPHQGWFRLEEVGGSTALEELTRQKEWDLCSLGCISEFVRTRVNIRSVPVIVTAKKKKKS